MGFRCFGQCIGGADSSGEAFFHHAEKLGSGVPVIIQIVDVSDHAWPDERKICLIAKCINDRLGDFSTGLTDARQSSEMAHALRGFGQSFSTDAIIGDVNPLSVRKASGSGDKITIAPSEHMIRAVLARRFGLFFRTDCADYRCSESLAPAGQQKYPVRRRLHAPA